MKGLLEIYMILSQKTSLGSIRQDTFDRFADGFPVYRVPHWNLKKSKEQVAELAEKYATAEVWKRQYNFVFKNCAHFVHYCYGEETHVSILKKQLFNRTVILTNRTAAELLFGRIEVKTDGVGLHAKATAVKNTTKCLIACDTPQTWVIKPFIPTE
uniref:LRAT domain-containing protein n=1 Tax=Panagrellus redivivus TaxID=6233 RepID=A0A7E4ZTT7_PANRE